MRAIKPPLRVSEQGFTLLEIMVVVVIIGLLVAAVAPNLIRNIDTAEIGRAKQDLREIETSLNLYRLENFRYPSTSEGLEALVTNPGEAAAPNWKQVCRVRQSILGVSPTAMRRPVKTVISTYSRMAPIARKAAKVSMPTSVFSRG